MVAAQIDLACLYTGLPLAIHQALIQLVMIWYTIVVPETQTRKRDFEKH
jgi:hypothetical protein